MYSQRLDIEHFLEYSELSNDGENRKKTFPYLICVFTLVNSVLTGRRVCLQRMESAG